MHVWSCFVLLKSVLLISCVFWISAHRLLKRFCLKSTPVDLAHTSSVVEGVRQVYYTLCRSTPATLIHCSPRGGKQVYKGRAPHESSGFDSLFTVHSGRKIHSKHLSWKAVLKTLGRLSLVEKKKIVENVVSGSDCGRCVNICSSNS